MDYRNMVAVFSKTLTMSMSQPPACLAAAGGQAGVCWTVLGYFDFLQIYPLPQKKDSWLGDVLRHNQQLSANLDGKYYFHPLHLTAGESKIAEEEEYKRFWTEHNDMPFLFLTLVQEATPDSVQTVREAVMSSDKRDSVPRICYHTMELSDLAVVWRSSSLLELFQEIHDLYRLESVGDMSSFSAIDRKFIDQFFNGKGPEVDSGKRIFASARYVVRNAKKSHYYLQQLKSAEINTDCVYFSTGMEDLHMLLEDISVADFLHFLYVHLNNPYQDAFFECSTRLGISEDFQETLLSDTSLFPKDSFFFEKCKLLLTKFQSTRKITFNSTYVEQSWIKPTSSLLNALVDMSKNWVMDGFCYLIYDAARLFCEKIEEWNAMGCPLNVKTEINLVQRFVRGWGSLMEQATRTDGRFIQMPGFSPAVCEIPAHLLECYLSIMMCCANLMVVQPEKNDVALLLVPKICRRMKVYSILDKIRSNKHLLYVDIPMEMLYDPISVLCGLCHELAHNVGDIWRSRRKRGMRILYGTAYELASRLELNSPLVVQAIYTTLKDVCESENRSSIEYATELSDLICGGVNAILGDDEEFSRWNNLYKANKNLSGPQIREVQKRSSLNRSNLRYGDLDFFDEIENLIYLFRECYADMVMLYLLRPDWTTYEALAIQELHTLSGQDNEFWESESYCTLVDRWGLVIAVVQKNHLWNTVATEWKATQLNTPISERFHSDVRSFIEWFNGYGGENPGHRSKESLQQVFDYLSDCYVIIDASFHNDGSDSDIANIRRKNLANLHTIISKLSSEYNINYEAFEGFIMQYRDKLLSSN